MKELEKKAEEFLSKAPEGKLRCAINKGSYQYYIGKEYQGKKQRKLVQKIAQKEYNRRLLVCIKKQKSALENLLEILEECGLEEVYAKLHPARRQLVEPYIKPIEEVITEFENIQYKGKSFEEDDTTAYYTEKGERVRSKSEKIIADTLHRKGIPYHYELPMELKYRNRTIVVYPDFTVLNKRTGKRYILEHLGMMDKASYYEKNMWKIDVYEKNGILLEEVSRDLTDKKSEVRVQERKLELIKADADETIQKARFAEELTDYFKNTNSCGVSVSGYSRRWLE